MFRNKKSKLQVLVWWTLIECCSLMCLSHMLCAFSTLAGTILMAQVVGFLKVGTLRFAYQRPTKVLLGCIQVRIQGRRLLKNLLKGPLPPWYQVVVLKSWVQTTSICIRLGGLLTTSGLVRPSQMSGGIIVTLKTIYCWKNIIYYQLFFYWLLVHFNLVNHIT